MANNLDQYDSYEKVKARLDEIVAAVSDGSQSLDDALDLYEEAVKLGMRASDMIELQPIAPAAADGSAVDAADAVEGAAAGAGTAAGAAAEGAEGAQE